MALELDEQCETLGVAPTRLWLAATGPTHSGLLLGTRLLDWSCPVTGVTPIEWTNAAIEELVSGTANAAARLLDQDTRFAPADVHTLHDYVGPGYAVPSADGLAAMRLAARTDAILLDPVYTGKAMAALIDHVRQGRLTAADTVIFVHTGGLPATFAYRDAILAVSQE
jgi:1-aminocyclopropane-1-carboxylate deaminase/D-cysteine desulfhydrase-like pyridoxal-dependent ACC family enzyme